ncbi:MAG: PAS domain S-box protein [Candidatus Bathyarchaeota archaeon]|nr:PAS domain S-box protein [Candidatus Bathyarchaeota archaeon]
MFPNTEKLTGKRANFLLELHRKALRLQENELYEYFLNHAVSVTESKIGFFHFVSEDQKKIKLTCWNKQALKGCSANYDSHYPIEQAGNWADSIRLKHPIIYNDFERSPNQRGFPNGHVQIKRLLSYPMIEKGKVYAVFGIGNKEAPYTKRDLVKLELIANELNQILQQRRIRAKLQESEQRWQTTLASIGDAVITTDTSGNINFMNAVAEDLTGWKISEAKNKPLKEVFKIINEFTRKEVEDPVTKVTAEGAIVGLANHTLLVKKDGTEVPIDDSGAPIKDKEGNVTGVVLVFRDITERKKAEDTLRESELKFRTVANFTYDWEYWVAPNGNIIYISPSCEGFTGYSPDEFINDPKLLTRIVHPDDKIQIGDHFDLLKSNKPHSIDFRIVKRDGEVRWVSHACQPVFDDDGKWIGRRASNRDITERKKAEEALIESQKRLNRSQEIAHLGSWELDLINNKLTWSDEVYRIFGLNPHEFSATYETFLERVHPEDRAAVDAAYTGSIKEGKDTYAIEHRIVRKTNGEIRIVQEKCEHIRDRSGKIIRSIGMVQDITERKKIEQSLYRAKVDWERTFNSVPDLIAILDDNHRIIRANKAMAQALGTTPEKCIGLHCYTCVHGTESPPSTCPHSKSMIDKHEHIAEVHEDRLGGDFIVSTTPLKDENESFIGSVHVARDITERKKAEDALRKSEERYRSYIEVTGQLGWITNAKGEVTEDIPSFRKYTGQSFEEVKGWGWSNALHPDDYQRTVDVWKKAVEFKTNYEVEYRLRRADGVYRHFLAHGVPILNEDGSVREWVGTCIDITSRKEIESELIDTLKASQDRQSEVTALLEASKAVLVHREFRKAAKVIFDSCKNLLDATAGYVALLSADGKENDVLFLDSGDLSCTVDPSLPMPIRGLRAQVYQTGKVVYCNDFANSPWLSFMPKGHVTLKNVLFAPLTINNKTVGIIGLANKHDSFTRRDAQMAAAFGEIASIALINSQMLEKLEANEKLLKAHSDKLEQLVEEKTKQLRDSERLAAIGATAGMVGHDIRNPLQAIISDLYLAKTELAPCPHSPNKTQIEESLREIEKNVEYINKIVADLQDFARPIKPNRKPANLQRICDEVLRTLSMPNKVAVSCTIDEDATAIFTDEDMLKRILINLVNNAFQAMPQGGSLAIRAQREDANIAISVQDSGLGIPETAKSQLFTPLFTTKSKGQGFGLAVVKRLTEALNGKVTFDSKIGTGTTFKIHLPSAHNKKSALLTEEQFKNNQNSTNPNSTI